MYLPTSNVIEIRANDEVRFTTTGSGTVNILRAIGSSNSVTLGGGTGATHSLQVNSVASMTRYLTIVGSNGGDPAIGTSAGAIQLSAELKLSSNNTVSSAAAVASTNKIMMVVNGTTYYLLATTVP